jgi:uncharacterized protein involved in copper resistance
MDSSKMFGIVKELTAAAAELPHRKTAVGKKDSWQVPRMAHFAASVHTHHTSQWYAAPSIEEMDSDYAWLMARDYIRTAGRHEAPVVSLSVEIVDLAQGPADEGSLRCCEETRVERFA